jgi:hypothetical protein
MLLLLSHDCNTLLIIGNSQYIFKPKFLREVLMEAILEKISKREQTKQTYNFNGYMPRIYEVQSPCQWLSHCQNGKCPAFVRLNGNFYCAKTKKAFG